MSDRLSGDEVRAIRTGMQLSEMEFALLFGVTMRAVELWECGVVVPSRLTSMVIRAEAAKRAAADADAEQSLGLASARGQRPRPARLRAASAHS